MRGRRAFAAVAVCLALVAVSCGDDGDDEPTSQPTGEQTESTASEETPRVGGEITFGTYSEAVSLDPVKMTGSGVTGAIELSAIYDTIVAYDQATRGYVLRTAESLEPNADFTEWTLVLKPGITFGDGAPYDANAVIASIKRHQDPSNPTVSRGTSAVIKEMTATDDRTVVFRLVEAWAGFPYLLADKVGMIVSPAAVEKYGADFGTPNGYEGAGAGPFVVESYKPKESLVLRKNPQYHGGEVYLDRVTFVNIVGAAATYEGLKADTLDVAFLREPAVIKKAQDEGYEGFINIQQAGGVIAFNHGARVTCAGGKPESVCAGQPDDTQVATQSPTSSETVRRALITAIDTDVLNERVFEGTGKTGGKLFKEDFPWYDPDAPAFEHDPEEAKRLVEQAKREGWDGKVRLDCANTPESRNAALAVETMWRAVGVEPIVTVTKSTADLVAQYVVQKDFDAVCVGYNVGPDDGAINTLNTNLRTPGALARWGYGNAEMDALLVRARAADSDDERREVFAEIEELYVRDAVALPYAATIEAIMWDDHVRGIVPSQQTVVLLDKAWVAD